MSHSPNLTLALESDAFAEESRESQTDGLLAAKEPPAAAVAAEQFICSGGDLGRSKGRQWKAAADIPAGVTRQEKIEV